MPSSCERMPASEGGTIRTRRRVTEGIRYLTQQ